MLKHHRCHALISGKDAGDVISSGLVAVVPSQTEILILVSLFVKPYLLYIRWRFFFHFILSHGDSCCGIEVNLEKQEAIQTNLKVSSSEAWMESTILILFMLLIIYADVCRV